MFDNRMIGDVHVLTPRKNLVGGEETTSLISAVTALTAAGESRVVLDLQRISWVSLGTSRSNMRVSRPRT